MCRAQIARDPWPDFASFDAARHPAPARVRAGRQWWRRARKEYGSVHEFTAVAHALTTVRAPIDVLGALARLVTDEVRHAELCAAMARAMLPERAPDDPDVFVWTPPRAPFPPAPQPGADGDPAPVLAWAADAVLCSCCIGETVSRPLYEAHATLATDPVVEGVLRQILRDEHLHAAFGWETLGWLIENLDTAARATLEDRLAQRLAQFERTCAAGHPVQELAGVEVTVARDPSAPNLGTLDSRTYAAIFYATLESEVLPAFTALGFDAMGAWARRPRV